jgi:acyl carrier protein
MTGTESRIARICASMLELDFVGAEDDIYTLGCDSLQAVNIAIAIEREFNVGLPLQVMESSGQIKQVAAWIDEALTATQADRSGVA